MSVYKITDGEKVYYGSTIKTLKKRLFLHKYTHNNCETRHMNKDNMTIELIEEVEDEEQLKWRERYYIENNECVNKYIPIRTEEERIQYQKTYNDGRYMRNKEKYRQYNHDNKELIKQRKTIPYHCECGSLIQITEKSRHFKSKKHIKFINNIDE